jgi:pyruvate dehydrogenase E2 component (dihydrolipoamide acetyltransferase)
MARLLLMPEVAANATEAVLQEWQVAVDGSFAATDTIATVETEKAVVDVEAETDGVLLRILVPNGSQVEVGAPIALLGEAGEEVPDLDALMVELGVAGPVSTSSPVRRDVPDRPDARAVAAVQAHGHTRIFASPLARRMAREAGLAVEDIEGSGPRGRILRRDVEAAVTLLAGAPPTPAPAPVVPAVSSAGFTDVPHTRMRRAIARRLTESKQTVPHFYLRASVRADALMLLRADLNEGGTARISVNDLVVKAAARAHGLVPEMNVVWTDDALRFLTSVDVSVAVATDTGLLTPVLRGVETLSVSAVATRVRDLADRAKAGRLRQDELEGGSLSVTNLGMFGTEEFAAIINPPQSAILAVGAVREEPVVVDGALAVGSVMRLTLSVDHRSVDGVLAARWMQKLVSMLERPVQILA